MGLEKKRCSLALYTVQYGLYLALKPEAFREAYFTTREKTDRDRVRDLCVVSCVSGNWWSACVRAHTHTYAALSSHRGSLKTKIVHNIFRVTVHYSS